MVAYWSNNITRQLMFWESPTDVTIPGCEEKPGVLSWCQHWNILGGLAPLSKGDISNLASKGKNIMMPRR